MSYGKLCYECQAACTYAITHLLGTTSQQWYPWSPNNSPHKLWLCTLCWIYWKKYGGLKRPGKQKPIMYFDDVGSGRILSRGSCLRCYKVHHFTPCSVRLIDGIDGVIRRICVFIVNMLLL